MKKKYIGMLLALLLPTGFVACSDDDAPQREPEVITPTDKEEEDTASPQYYTQAEPYINQFCYDQMSYYYLWWKDIDATNWYLDADPIKKIESIRYEEDRWSMAIENIKPYTEPSTTTSGTYGYDFQPYWADESQKNIVAVVTMVYPGSPAEEAGLKRGSVILQIDGKNIRNTSEDYRTLQSSASVKLTVAFSMDEFDAPRQVSMTSVDMYLDPVLYEKVFACGDKKVGYVFFNDFSMECNERLIQVARKFKAEGVSELVLDLRYNGGGYVVTEELLASLLAPEANVKAGDLYQTAVYNGTGYYKDMEAYYGAEFSNTYFTTKHEWEYRDKKYAYDTSDANIGLTKIYGLVSGGTASASEAILVSMMPFVDVEIIGTQTEGKHCSGVMFEAVDYYQDYEDFMEKLKKEDKAKYNELVDKFWKYYSGWKNYVGDWGVYLMLSTYADKDGNNPCRPDGLTPDVEIADEPRAPYPLGDDREALLREALTRAGYQDFTPLPEASSRALQTDVTGRPLRLAPEGRRILLKPELPNNRFSVRALGVEG